MIYILEHGLVAFIFWAAFSLAGYMTYTVLAFANNHTGKASKGIQNSMVWGVIFLLLLTLHDTGEKLKDYQQQEVGIVQN